MSLNMKIQEVILEADCISRKFSDGDQLAVAFEELSLKVHRSDFFVITGPSGAGKSTLLHILSGLDFPSGGEVRFLGESLNGMSDKRISDIRNQGFGFIFQIPHLLPDRTVRENIALPFQYGKMKQRKDVAERCDELLDYVGLLEMAERYPNTLSGGEMQRVGIARAMAREPKVIFADEPTGSLDSANSDKVVELLQQQTDVGCAVIMVTHDESMLQYSSKHLILDKFNNLSR